jgi:hypothetical protein
VSLEEKYGDDGYFFFKLLIFQSVSMTMVYGLSGVDLDIVFVCIYWVPIRFDYINSITGVLYLVGSVVFLVFVLCLVCPK